MMQTMTEAVEKLRELIPDEDAVVIDDGAVMWHIDTLVDETRAADREGVQHDLIIEPWGIVKLNADGFRESIPEYRVKPRYDDDGKDRLEGH